MTTSDPQQILEQIKARADKATPGPWELLTSRESLGAWFIPRVSPVLHAHRADAEFIAHSRSDNDRIRGALAEVLALAAAWDAVADQMNETAGPHDPYRGIAIHEVTADMRDAIEAKLNEEEG